MQGVSWEKKLPRKLAVPAGFDEAKIELFVRPINLVADQRMSEVRQVHSDLVGPSGAGNCPHDREFLGGTICPNETFFDLDLSDGRGPKRMNDLLQPNGRRFVIALACDRGIDRGVFPFGPAVDDCE